MTNAHKSSLRHFTLDIKESSKLVLQVCVLCFTSGLVQECAELRPLQENCDIKDRVWDRYSTSILQSQRAVESDLSVVRQQTVFLIFLC